MRIIKEHTSSASSQHDRLSPDDGSYCTHNGHLHAMTFHSTMTTGGRGRYTSLSTTLKKHTSPRKKGQLGKKMIKQKQ